MNPAWENSGGRLRLLKSADNLDDMIMEVPPTEGTLLAFKRADNSWHGHKPFAGERRVIQFNWVTSEGDRRMAMLRHHVSAPLEAPVRRHAAERGLNGSYETLGPRGARKEAGGSVNFFSLALLSTGAFVSTNIDDLFLLVGFFSDRSFSRRHIFAGQILGMAIIVAISLAAASQLLRSPPSAWACSASRRSSSESEVAAPWQERGRRTADGRRSSSGRDRHTSSTEGTT